MRKKDMQILGPWFELLLPGLALFHYLSMVGIGMGSN
jgi:hypothetical protein